MPERQTLKRYIFFACTALSTCTLMSAPAYAGFDIPTGAPPSPLLNGTTAFSQKMPIFEEFGLQRLPEADTGSRLPVPGGCDKSPNSAALDDFLKQPLSPLPTREANDQGQNPWLAQINSC